MMIVPIPDPADPRLDDYRRLNDVGYRRSFEAQRRVLIAEGSTVVDRLLASPIGIRSVLCLERMVDHLPPEIDVPVYTVDRDTMRSVVGFDLHRGIVASASRPEPVAVSSLLDVHALAVIEGINDSENLGAILRAAVGLGMGGVVLDPTTADPWYRRSVRVSMGGVFCIPIARSTDWKGDLAGIRRAGFTLVAMTPAEEADSVFEVEVDRPAVMLGAEGPGLSPAALEAADVRLRIPMTEIDSLNVGQAAAVAFAALRRE